ncbi:uncharacterized protein LOC100900066 [Galendromus occidentalis]|uniref:Uncharacterized protein LOC100900066 n=1 Tax=Galendromus occidentalis TaxID=34638 RepID=A0AAJ6QSG8_9ACAR|nr:uncharacterized protein LOC100900066 [Galendromus occidentalis]
MSANFRKKKCIVTSCSRSTDDGVKLHRCGENHQEIGKALGKFNITKNTYICSLHFEPSCFSRKGGLNPDALPTLLLNADAPSVKHCDVPFCPNTDADVVFFKGRPAFAAIGKEIGVDLTKGWICGEHFEEDYVDDKGRLKANALPTLGFVTEDTDGALNQVTVHVVSSNQDSTVDLMLSDDVVADIVDDCKDLEVRAENNKLRLELQKTQEKLESLRKTVKLLQDDLVTKKRKIDNLEAELRLANKAARHFEVRIVNE